MLKVFAAAAALALGVASGPARAAIIGGDLSPFWNWKTLESPHFTITFPADLADIAQKTADDLEVAHALLAPRLEWQGWHPRTQILLVDNADSANGLTTPVWRIGIILYVTPPDAWYSTNYYDDWLQLLAIHEYTHLLNMDTVQDFYVPIRYALGDAILPNSFWPSWMLEGLAVYDETRFTHEGRGRSPLYEMILRAAVDEGKLDSPSFITLDKINGDNPYYPGGETAYLFGYQLMNSVAGDVRAHPGTQPVHGLTTGEDALGSMSYRSAGRIPYFINGNLENITGKDWYAYWNDWVATTSTRMHIELAKIRSQPVTPFKKLTQTGNENFGATVSPDGRWLAWHESSLDRISAIVLTNFLTGETVRIKDVPLAATMGFTPDSKKLIYSTLNRVDQYYEYSDLFAYDIDSDHVDQLTHGLRARDPDVSPDGSQIAFTLTTHGRTDLAIAPLQGEHGKLRVGPAKTLFGEPYGRVSNPKFSGDGKHIAFSYHPNGKPGEDLMQWDLATGQATTLVSDGHFNRFPAFDRLGALYFVSDATGIDNLYRWNAGGAAPTQLTNLTTGLWMPAFGPHSVYGSTFSTKGWDISELTLSPDAKIDSSAVTVAPATAPPVIQPSEVPQLPKHGSYPVHDYSAWPSLVPRTWVPYLALDTQGVMFGGAIDGFDAVDRHEYILAADYDSLIGKPDFYASYSNRSLGPTLTLTSWYLTNFADLPGGTLSDYGKQFKLSGSLSYPFRWTYSTLTPEIAFNAQREYEYFADGRTSRVDPSFIPSVDQTLTFQNALSSRLAISPEEGRVASVGNRWYAQGTEAADELFASDQEFLRVTDHTVLVPSVRGAWTTAEETRFRTTAVAVRGRFNNIINRFDSDSLDGLSLRGYPLETYYAKSAAIGSLDYRFPIWRIYRGWGTNPFFVDDLYGSVFAESAYFPYYPKEFRYLPSAGAEVDLSTELLLHVPLIFSLHFDNGFNSQAGGKAEVYFALNLGQFNF